MLTHGTQGDALALATGENELAELAGDASETVIIARLLSGHWAFQGGVAMLFAVTWIPTGGLTEDRDKRTLKLFSNWRPPANVEFKGFYDYADGNGGIAIVEAGSAEALLETTAPWATFFEFTTRPLVPSEKAASVYEKAIAWRDSIR